MPDTMKLQESLKRVCNVLLRGPINYKTHRERQIFIKRVRNSRSRVAVTVEL